MCVCVCASDADNSADFLPLMLCECIPSGREGPPGRAPSPSAGIFVSVQKESSEFPYILLAHTSTPGPFEPNRIAGFRRRSIPHVTREVQPSVMRCAFFRLYTHHNATGGKEMECTWTHLLWHDSIGWRQTQSCLPCYRE